MPVILFSLLAGKSSTFVSRRYGQVFTKIVIRRGKQERNTTSNTQPKSTSNTRHKTGVATPRLGLSTGVQRSQSFWDGRRDQREVPQDRGAFGRSVANPLVRAGSSLV